MGPVVSVMVAQLLTVFDFPACFSAPFGEMSRAGIHYRFDPLKDTDFAREFYANQVEEENESPVVFVRQDFIVIKQDDKSGGASTTPTK